MSRVVDMQPAFVCICWILSVCFVENTAQFALLDCVSGVGNRNCGPFGDNWIIIGNCGEH